MKSQGQYLIYNYTVENNFIQTNLTSISNNLFVYSNKIFDAKFRHSINLGAKKGFYFGRKLNKVEIRTNLSFSNTQHPTFIEDQEKKINITSWTPSFRLTYTPRKSFINEIQYRTNWNPRIFRLDDIEINRQTVTSHRLSIEGGGDKLNWVLDFDHLFYDVVGQRNFDVPDLSLLVEYQVSEKFALSLKGNYLFTLFNINNYNSIVTIPNGNVITQVFNDNNLGVLLLRGSIKI